MKYIVLWLAVRYFFVAIFLFNHHESHNFWWILISPMENVPVETFSLIFRIHHLMRDAYRVGEIIQLKWITLFNDLMKWTVARSARVIKEFNDKNNCLTKTLIQYILVRFFSLSFISRI